MLMSGAFVVGCAAVTSSSEQMWVASMRWYCDQVSGTAGGTGVTVRELLHYRAYSVCRRYCTS
jgi:hypothetical protein